jgi:hypothetical protein
MLRPSYHTFGEYLQSSRLRFGLVFADSRIELGAVQLITSIFDIWTAPL